MFTIRLFTIGVGDITLNLYTEDEMKSWSFIEERGVHISFKLLSAERWTQAMKKNINQKYL